MAVGRNDRLLLRFHSDLARVHERFVLTGDLEGGHHGVTPERKRVFMTLGDGAVKDIWLVDGMNVDRLPAGISAASAVRVKRSPLGEFTALELAYFDTHGRFWSVGTPKGRLALCHLS